jgi:hypothetical protein
LVHRDTAVPERVVHADLLPQQLLPLKVAKGQVRVELRDAAVWPRVDAELVDLWTTTASQAQWQDQMYAQ